MTRREWVLATGVGLLAGVTPACSHTMARAPLEATPRVENPAPVAQTQSPVVAAPPRSPYAEISRLPEGETKLDASPIAQARFPVDLPNNGATAPMPRLAGQSEQERDIQTSASPVSGVGSEVRPRLAEDPPLVAALRCYLNRKPAEAVVCLERYDRVNQDLLLCLLPLVVRLSEGSLQKCDSRELTNLLAELERLRRLIQPSAQLVIDKMCFVDGIDAIKGFGVYRQLEEEHEFQPGDVLQVYAELQNFSSAKDERTGLSAIRLKSEIRILDFNGRRVELKNFADEEGPDQSQTPRHDFFISYTWQLPRNMPDGRYTLRLLVTDVPTNRQAERTLDFRVMSARGCEPYTERRGVRNSDRPVRSGRI
jgi:hypothetical protein